MRTQTGCQSTLVLPAGKWLAIYGEYDANAMVANNAVSLSKCYCTFVLATLSHNYSDI